MVIKKNLPAVHTNMAMLMNRLDVEWDNKEFTDVYEIVLEFYSIIFEIDEKKQLK
jgi:hypothetical protein